MRRAQDDPSFEVLDWTIDVQAMLGRAKDEVLRGWLVLAEFLMERAAPWKGG